MRNLISALTLAALVAAVLPVAPALRAEDGGLAERLRQAVTRQEAANGGRLIQRGFTDAELDDLMAPIALYPDALLAQVLVAATVPDQVRAAGSIIADTPDMTDDELDDALSTRDWDPGVLVLLSGFPSVISRMANDMAWTERLGAAVIDQESDVLAATQRLRARAEAAGNLVSNPAQIISRDRGTIAIRPARRDVIYVPDYDPRTVYTIHNAPYGGPVGDAGGVAQGPLAPSPLIAGAIAFGAALLVTELFKDGPKPTDDWQDYWHRKDSIDWRGRRFHTRAFPDAPDRSAEDTSARRRHLEARLRAREHRMARPEVSADPADRQQVPREDRARTEHEAARAEARRRDRTAEARRQERAEDLVRQSRREERAKAEARNERREVKAKAKAEEARQQRREEKAKTEARQQRREGKARAETRQAPREKPERRQGDQRAEPHGKDRGDSRRKDHAEPSKKKQSCRDGADDCRRD